MCLAGKQNYQVGGNVFFNVTLKPTSHSLPDRKGDPLVVMCMSAASQWEKGTHTDLDTVFSYVQHFIASSYYRTF